VTDADTQPSFGAYSRDELRRSYADAWRKYVARSPMTPLEALIVDVLELHPEYQALVSNASAALAFDLQPAGRRRTLFYIWGCTSPSANSFRLTGPGRPSPARVARGPSRQYPRGRARADGIARRGSLGGPKQWACTR